MTQPPVAARIPHTTTTHGIVRDDPVKARQWLLTPPGGPEEISRINDLRPSFSACLLGGTMKFNRTVMRGTVAINYYRLTMATPVASKAQ